MLNNSGGWGNYNKMDTTQGYMDYNTPVDVEESLNSLLSDPYDFMSSPLSSVPAPPLISSTALPPPPPISTSSSSVPTTSFNTTPLVSSHMGYANNTYNGPASFLPPQITINNAPATFSPSPLVPTLPSPTPNTPNVSPVPSPTPASLNSMSAENMAIIPAQLSPSYPSSAPTTPATPARSLAPSKTDTKRKRSKKDDASGDEVFKGFDWDNFQPSQLSYMVYDAYTKQPLGDALDMILYKSGTNTHLSASENAWISYRQNQFRIVCLLRMPHGQLCVRDGPHEFEIKQFCVKLYAITSTPAGIREEVQVGLYHVGKTRVKKEKTEIVAIPFVDGKAEFTNLQFERSNAVKGQQEYYHLVATLYAKSHTVCYPILSKISPRIIVRGQHPGFYRSNSPVEQDQTQQVSPNTSTNSMMTNSITTTSTMTNSVMTTSMMTNYSNNANFVNNNNSNYASSDGSSPKTYISENDPVWQSGQGESVYHIGKVGINTSEPTEALTVHGNAIITGNIYTPSDIRIKHDFKSVDSSEQLRNIRQLNIYDYKVQDRSHRGVIAQELQAVMPRSVHCAGDVHINGNTVHDLLVVNERSLVYENIGATQHLDKELEREKAHIIDIDHRVEGLSQSNEKMKYEFKGTIRSLWDMLFAEETYQGDKNAPEWREEQVVFGVNLFRMGPARSFMVLGYFFSYLWLFGALYVFSNVKSRQIIGRACVFKFVLWWVIWTVFFWGGKIPWGIAIYYIIGGNLMLGNWRRNKRRMELRRQGREEELEGSGTNGWTTGWSCWERNFMQTSAGEKMDEEVAFLQKEDASKSF